MTPQRVTQKYTASYANKSMPQVQQKFRSLVLGFRVQHAHLIADIVAEEAIVMAHLKLVAGTTVAGTGQQDFHTANDEAPKAVGTRVAEQEAQARTAIRKLKPGLEDLTVEELLAEMNRNRGGVTMPMAKALHRNGQIRQALRAAGIHANSALPEQDLDVFLYGVVIEPRKLLKACPSLKPYAAVLEGITL